MSTVTRVEAPIVEDPEWTSLFDPNTDKVEEVTAMLGRQPVFDNLTNRELHRVERIVHWRKFLAGEVVIQAWVPRSGLFVVEFGAVNVVRQLPSGEDVVIGSLGAGELLGEFEWNVSFRFGGTPYDVAERGLKLFAKEVLPVLKSW